MMTDGSDLEQSTPPSKEITTRPPLLARLARKARQFALRYIPDHKPVENPEVAAYKAKRQELEVFKQRAGQIEGLMLKHNVYFVHTCGLHITYVSKLDLARDVEDFRGKLAIILDQKPDLSVASIRAGRGDHIWGPSGVVITGGIVKEAGQRDIMSFAQGIKDRYIIEVAQTEAEYLTNIQTAINRPDNPDKHNEFIVGGELDISGMFLDLDSIGGGGRWPYKEAFGVAAEFSMPFYVFKHGLAFEAKYDHQTDSVVLGQVVDTIRMSQRQYHIPEEKRAVVKALAQRQLKKLYPKLVDI